MENYTDPLSTENFAEAEAEAPDAPVLAVAVSTFLADIGAGHSPATVKTYRVSLSRFQLYLQSQLGLDPATLPVARLQPDWAVGCVRWIAAGQPQATTGQAAEPAARPGPRTPKTTVATYIAGLSRFYKWCALERWLVLPADDYERMALRLKDLRGKVQRTILDKVPADDILDALLAEARRPPETPPAPTPAPTEATTVTGAEKPAKFRGNVEKMAESDARRYQLLRLRNVALLETLKCTGARVSEITGLNRADLDATNRRARVVGKGFKERWVYFSPAAWEAIQLYLRSRTRLMGEAAALKSGSPSLSAPLRSAKAGSRARSQAADLAGQPLFARHDRGAGWKEVKPLLPHAVETMLWELVEGAGLEVKITPHRFRHWFATRMLSATGDLATTQDLLGHANPATTRIYAQVSETNKQKAHREVFGQ
ncbi:MAG: tyrosine-type recombinase/integrase [Chloroflexi bacterium]|nr:tyrosine-type recombinase/integrase [Chloroflexota bacterium]